MGSVANNEKLEFQFPKTPIFIESAKIDIATKTLFATEPKKLMRRPNGNISTAHPSVRYSRLSCHHDFLLFRLLEITVCGERDKTEATIEATSHLLQITEIFSVAYKGILFQLVGSTPVLSHSLNRLPDCAAIR
jgi:hypothetical protein